jgi:nucleoside-diphosphate-sugar epimerase
MNNAVLVTGASGFLGRHCLPLLVEAGFDVHALSRRPERISIPGVCRHAVDLLAPGSAAEVMSHIRPQYLLHLAWYAVPGRFWEARENLEWLRASLELLLAFAGCGGERLVIAGSCAEYDWNDADNRSAGECSETATPLLPGTLYGSSKHALERVLYHSRRQTGVSSAWGRIFFLYGPNEHPERLVAYAIHSLLQGEPAHCSDGRQVRDFLHITDAAAAFVALLCSEVEGPVNIASGIPVSIRQVLEQIGQETGRPDLLRYGARDSNLNNHGSGDSSLNNRRAEPARLWANVSRLQEQVSFHPQYDLATGIRQTVEWWRHSLDRDPLAAAGAELDLAESDVAESAATEPAVTEPAVTES